MNIAQHNFEKHGHTSFDTWLENGQTLCVAFRENAGMTVGLLPKELWREVEWTPEKADFLRGHLRFMRIFDVKIVKSGWFAFATVDFSVAFGRTMRAKTDKGFAEFLASMTEEINLD